jgi:hypothetical protein
MNLNIETLDLKTENNEVNIHNSQINENDENDENDYSDMPPLIDIDD